MRVGRRAWAALVIGTLRALGARRRAVPAGIVIAAVLAAEWLATSSPTALLVDLVLVAAFALVAPASYRLFCASDRRRPILGLAAYLLLGAALVGAAGLALPRALSLPGTYMVEPRSVGVVLALFLVGGWGLGRDIELEEGMSAARARAAALAVEAERAEILALRANLDPHFLFNILNAIAEWCREDPKVAEAALLRLASMLRAMLQGIRSPSWPLAAEIALVRDLFALHQVRDPERYRFSLDAPDPLPEAHVPPMLLLPLVENAITHGPSAGHEGEVALTVREAPGGISLRIENPGAYAGRREGGQGIDIVLRRLSLAYGGRASLSLRAEGARTITDLTLPLRPVDEETLA